MCGIFGVWYPDGRPVDEPAVNRSRDTLTNRGPDDAGTWLKDNVALRIGASRSSIFRPTAGCP